MQSTGEPCTFQGLQVTENLLCDIIWFLAGSRVRGAGHCACLLQKHSSWEYVVINNTRTIAASKSGTPSGNSSCEFESPANPCHGSSWCDTIGEDRAWHKTLPFLSSRRRKCRCAMQPRRCRPGAFRNSDMFPMVSRWMTSSVVGITERSSTKSIVEA